MAKENCQCPVSHKNDHRNGKAGKYDEVPKYSEKEGGERSARSDQVACMLQKDLTNRQTNQHKRGANQALDLGIVTSACCAKN